MRNIIAIILIASSIGIFFGYIKPTYSSLDVVKDEIVIYNDTLEQADIITQKLAQDQEEIRGLDSASFEKLNKLLPESVDNVRLIIDISNIAANSGLSIRNINLETSEAPEGNVASRGALYDSIDFSFNVSTTYSGFLNFLSSLERSLRLVDIVSISFTPPSAGSVYDFNVTVRTYWLK